MNITDNRIDAGKAFDFGKTAQDYARYRDIYPDVFYQKIAERGLCVKEQKVLDLGTGTGVLPRHLARYGADWIGVDISPEQIEQARRLAAEAGLAMEFRAVSAEEMDFPDGSFDVITACQCFGYFDHRRVMPKLAKLLKPGGKLVILYMAWLPGEDPVVAQSEALVLRYSPAWTGGGEVKRPIPLPAAVFDDFQLDDHEEYDLAVPFTRESWHGRMKSCRGVGASLSGEERQQWDAEHRALLAQIAPERFEVRHYAALAVLKRRSPV